MNNYKCPYDHDQPEFRLEWYEENFEKLLVALSDALSWSPSDNRWCPPDNRKYILAALNIPNEGHTK